MNRSIAVIGGGASALAFLNSYVQLYQPGRGLPDSIFVFEKSGTFGPGVAYEMDLATNLLNTKTGFITPFEDRPSDFYAWLLDHPEEWRRQFPSFVVDADSYAPRPLFGIYLRSRFNWLVKRAAGAGIRLIQLHAEVIDIFPLAQSYGIITSCAVTVHAEHVVLAVGTIQRSGSEKADASNLVFSNPYPVADLTRTVPKSASVAILGARLSCIDAVIALISQGHQGKITIHSRSGYLPAVRGNQGRLSPKLFTIERIRDLARPNGKISLDILADLFIQELRANNYHPSSTLTFEPPTDIAAYLRSEIAESAYPRVWQAVLYATNGFIGDLWTLLEPADQKKLMTELFSAFMSYRVSYPPANAALLLRYVETGQVDFVAGRFAIDSCVKQHTVLMADGKTRSYDCLVWATGAPRSIDELESELIRNLSNRGMATPHAMGGVKVDPQSLNAIGANGSTVPSLRVLGELTNGQFFFTSALEILVKQARRCADALVRDVSAQQGREYVDAPPQVRAAL